MPPPPAAALLEGGVNYIELRSIDNNIFSNTGIELTQLYFIELLVIHSLFSDNSEISEKEYVDIKNNLTNIAHKGRDKETKIIKKNNTLDC